MVLLKSDQQNKMVLIIGLGLIGSAVLNRFLRLGWISKSRMNVDWSNSEFFKTDFLNWVFKSIDPSLAKFEIIWAAGKSGFGSTQNDCMVEELHFLNFLDAVDGILSKFSFRYNVNLISSAGALFEGQMNVDASSIPAPRRPYGNFKLWQEQILSRKFPGSYYIFRPSSVYGPIKKGKRLGLISKMVKCVIDNSEITISGGLSTLRDFIWVEDVANPIVEVVLGRHPVQERIFFLVSAKPTSILEVDELIKKVTKRKTLFKFDKTLNFSSMSFSRRIKSFSNINLELGIKLIHLNSYELVDQTN